MTVVIPDTIIFGTVTEILYSYTEYHCKTYLRSKSLSDSTDAKKKRGHSPLSVRAMIGFVEDENSCRTFLGIHDIRDIH